MHDVGCHTSWFASLEVQKPQHRVVHKGEMVGNPIDNNDRPFFKQEIIGQGGEVSLSNKQSF